MAKTQNTFTLTFDTSESNMTREQAKAMLKAELDRADASIKRGCISLAESKRRHGIS
jgi:hypothetical protein